MTPDALCLRNTSTAQQKDVGVSLESRLVQEWVAALSRGAAGEFGKILYGDGTFEDALSGPGILLKHQQSGGKEMTLKEIWASKTRIAAKTRADASLALAQLAEHIVVTLDPDIIVIGGGVTNYDIIAPAKRIYKSPLVKSKLGVDAGIIGATIAADF
jgi:predicted NBD/HSP70 family sugar kinase